MARAAGLSGEQEGGSTVAGSPLLPASLHQPLRNLTRERKPGPRARESLLCEGARGEGWPGAAGTRDLSSIKWEYR